MGILPLAQSAAAPLIRPKYEVCIDSSLEDRNLTYGECYFPGQSKDEVLVSCHVCHPSLANDNLSGLAVATFLARMLSGQNLRYSYPVHLYSRDDRRYRLASPKPAKSEENPARIGVTCVRRRGRLSLQEEPPRKCRNRSGGIARTQNAAEPRRFSIHSYGYDERQYCSPGFDLPVGCLMRSVWGTFPEYHASADNLDFIRPEAARAIAAPLHLYLLTCLRTTTGTAT